MLLNNDQVQHINSIAHAGKVIVIATCDDGSLHYTVRQDGFEQSCLNATGPLSGWESWKRLPLPDDAAGDPSVAEREKASLTLPKSSAAGAPEYVMRSRYQTRHLTAPFSVQLISTPDYLYVFRQSLDNTLLVDRFVLDGITNELKPKIEVRYRRSKQKYSSQAATKRRASGIQSLDTLDFTDVAGNYFYEPSTELCFIQNLLEGRFAVVRAPTSEHDRYRWHIFTYQEDPVTQQGRLELVSVRTSEEGLFDVKDATVFDPGPRTIPGILRRTLDVSPARVLNGPAATLYDIQKEVINAQTQESHLLRVETRVMLAVPTDLGVTTLSFAIAADGTLSQISDTLASQKVLRSDQRVVLLPINTLDQILPLGAMTPPPQGAITGLLMGTDADLATGRVIVTSPEAGSISGSDVIEISGTPPLNGLYQVTGANASGFEIAAPSPEPILGTWEKQVPDDNDSLIFDGMLTSYRILPSGKLQVNAVNHGLAIGDQVQIVGSTSYDGEYPVTSLDGSRFIIDTPWAKAEAQNVKLIARRRRGVEFDGRVDSLSLPPESLPTETGITIGFWARSKDDGSVPGRCPVFIEALGDDLAPVVRIRLAPPTLRFVCGSPTNEFAFSSKQPFLVKNEWVHWTFTKDVASGVMAAYRNGVLVTKIGGRGDPILAANQKGIRSITVGRDYQGTLADLRIFSRALTEKEIHNTMWVPLSGTEADLCGSWPLGAIVEDKERTVLDFSPNGRDGTLSGSAYVSACVLPLLLADGKTPVVKYRNDELFAVVQGGTYLEEFEFRIESASKVDPNNVDGKLHPIFLFSYWGQRDRGADPQPITAGATVFADAGSGWYRASCQVTIPQGICLLRSFEINKVTGTWTAQDQVEIRRHKISLVSDAITETCAVDAVGTAAAAVAGSAQDKLLMLQKSCRDLAALEQQEGALLLEHATLTSKLARLKDLGALQLDVQTLKAKVAEAGTRTQKLLADYNYSLDDPRNRVCRMQVEVPGGWRWIAAGLNSPMYIQSSGGSRVRFVPTPDVNQYQLQIEYGANAWGAVHVLNQIDKEENQFVLLSDGGNRFCVNRVVNGTTHISVLVNGNWRYLIDHYGQTNDTNPITIYPSGPGHTFKLFPSDEVFGSAIDDARAAWQRSKLEYEGLVEYLKTMQDLSAGSQADYEKRLVTVNGALAAIHASMTARQSKAFLNDIMAVNGGGAPVSWPMEKLRIDRRGLLTQRGSLPFVNAGTRISAVQTCEGHVQLAYVDQDGRMQQVVYNATADRAAGTTFDRWFPAPPRGCCVLAKDSSVIALEQPILLPADWTIEAWFYYPLPETAWNVLTSSADGQASQIVVRDGKYLGTRYDGLFLSSGYSLSKLTPGWHHVAAVKRGGGSKGTIAFYVDGEPIDDRLTAASSILILNGGSDVITLSKDSLPTGSAMSFSVLLKDAPGPLNAYLLRATDSAKTDLLSVRINHTPNVGTVEFNCGPDSLSYKFERAQKESWTHWVFVKNVALGTMSIYRDGKLATAATGRKAALPVTTTSLVMGQGYAGAILEPSLWSKELWASEVGSWLGRTPSGGEDGLVGSWSFAEKTAADRGPKKKNGSLDGAPVLTPLSFDGGARIDLIGNLPDPSNKPAQTTAVSPSVLTLNGSSAAVLLNPASLPTGNELTICFWLKGASSLPSYNSVISAFSAQGARLLNIHMPWSDGILYYDCGATDNKANDRIQQAMPAQVMKGAWVHWAFTKNSATGEMKIYCNGVLWASGSGKTKPLVAAQWFVLGAFCERGNQNNYWPGQVAELSIWSKALSEAEIQSNKDRTLSGTEPNLCAYYRFDAGRATDLSGSKRDGQYVGSPTAATDPGLVFTSVAAGLALPGQQFGKLAEVRVWGCGLSGDEIAVNSTTILTGNEPGLKAYYAMRAPVSGKVHGHTDTDPDGKLTDGEFLACNPPIGNPGSGVLACDGISDFITLPAMKLDFTLGLTIEAWILQNDAKQSVSILDLGNGPIASPTRLDVIRMALLSSGALLVQIGTGTSMQSIQADGGLDLGRWTHVAVTISAKGQATLYKNGRRIKSDVLSLPLAVSRSDNFIGQSEWPSGASVAGQLAEVRIWNVARSDRELLGALHRSLCGKEPGLQGYWPLDQLRPGNNVGQVADHSRNNLHGTLSGSAQIALSNDLPVGLDAIVCAEYSTLGFDPEDPTRKQAMMRRFFGGRVLGATMLLPEKRIEAAELVWVGNGQFAPTLLGYIEGAPPVPSENLTGGGDYNGATSVELSTSEDLTFSWNQSQSNAVGGSLDFFLGIDTETLGGLGVYEEILSVRLGLKGSMGFSKESSTSTNISSTSSETMADRVELRGTTESKADFPQVGTRFVPKNVGYALVISSLADVFITRLAKSNRMVGYTVQPVEGIPPDVNTISFLMNPAYVMQGSLDGMVGSRAASNRFHRNVPEMRSQYGSLYPSSYYKILDAYALKQKIEGDDKRRAAYFAQFSASDPNSFAGQIAKTAEGDSQGATAYQQKIRDLGDSAGARLHATSCFAGWQKQMENLLIQAGKRNIVNTYVWDANGGLHTDQQSFSSTVEHSIGGSFSFDSSLGFESNISVFGAAFDLTAMVNLNMNQTVSKTQSSTGAVQLNVDLSGVEFSGITDALERPIVPGEKVNRYRFMTFYLEGSTDNYNDFFRQVVDPEWLQTNSEEARALRQAMGKANKAWRVLHRVTYVERPTLASAGDDSRAMQGQAAQDEGTDQLLTYFGELSKRHQDLVARIDRTDAQIKDVSTRLDRILKLLTK